LPLVSEKFVPAGNFPVFTQDREAISLPVTNPRLFSTKHADYPTPPTFHPFQLAVHLNPCLGWTTLDGHKIRTVLRKLIGPTIDYRNYHALLVHIRVSDLCRLEDDQVIVERILNYIWRWKSWERISTINR
jgi:hypothetical protein